MEWSKAYQEINALLRLRTYPVAVKYFPNFDEDLEAHLMDEGFVRPSEPLNVCQIIGLARYYLRSSFFTVEDMACIVGAVVLGLYPMPENMKSGYMALAMRKNQDLARGFIETVPMIKYGEVKAVACAPLHQTTLNPDQVIVYGNSVQVMRLIQAYLWDKAGRVQFSSGGEYGLCGDVMAQSYITKGLALGIPCVGERMTSMTGDDELSVGIPINAFNSVLNGLESTKAAAPYPIPFGGLNRTPDYLPDYFLTEYARNE
jgi:uncharacterized protein (DUF169 family)